MLEVATEATYRRSVLPPYGQSRDVAQSGWRNGALAAKALALSAPPALTQLGHGVRT